MINKVILLGYVGSDVRYYKSQPTGRKSSAGFSVATTIEWKDMHGDKQTKTEWHYVIVYGAFADAINEHSIILKGDGVYVEGSLSYWRDKDNQNRVSVIADEIKRVSRKNDTNVCEKKDTTPIAKTEVRTQCFVGSSNVLLTEEDDLPF